MNTAESIALLNFIAAICVGAAIVFATIRGPVIATRQSDERREFAKENASKMWVFRQLMGHRFDVTHQDFVGALNLIQIEFSDRADVIHVFKDFIEEFSPRQSERNDVGSN